MWKIRNRSECAHLGTIALTKVMTDLLVQGFKISIPIDNTTAYDLIIEKDGILKKIQVKGGAHIRDGSVVFRASRSRKTGKEAIYNVNEVDIVANYCKQTETIYYVLLKEIYNKSNVNLRLSPYKNKCSGFIKWANDYKKVPF